MNMTEETISESQQVAEFRAAASLLIERIQWMRQHGISFKGERDLYEILGYERVITAKDYRDTYARGGIAGRIIDALPKATWRGGVELIEDEDPENETPFEKAWMDLDKRLNIIPMLQRADILAGQGRYAVLLLGGPGELDTPMPKSRPEKLIYVSPFAEDDALITEWCTDSADPRFGLPNKYMLRRMDVTSQNFTKNCHWSRVIHIAEDCLDNDVYGMPQLERVWNLLHDLEKVTGGGAEAFWLRANQGLQLDVDKDMDLKPEAKAALADEVEQYRHNISRVMKTRGVTPKVLGSDVANFANPADAILTQIAGSKSIPKRILTGSEMGQLASSQDRDNWKDQINGRQTSYAGPFIVRRLVDRLIEFGFLPKPGAKAVVSAKKTFVAGKPKKVEGEEEKPEVKVEAKIGLKAAAKIGPVDVEKAKKDGLESKVIEDDAKKEDIEDPDAEDEDVEDVAAAADYEVRWAHIQTLTEEEKSDGASKWAGTKTDEGQVFTRSEIRDKWYQLPPLTDEQLAEMAASAAANAPQVPMLDENGQPMLDENGQPIMQPAPVPGAVPMPGAVPGAPTPGAPITQQIDQLLAEAMPEEEEDPKKKFPFKAAGGDGSGVIGHNTWKGSAGAARSGVPGKGGAGKGVAFSGRAPAPGNASVPHTTPEAAQQTFESAANHLVSRGFKIGPLTRGNGNETRAAFTQGRVTGTITLTANNTVTVALNNRPGAPAPRTFGKGRIADAFVGETILTLLQERKFSSTQVNLPPTLAAKIKKIGLQIADEDLADDGREDKPHVTVKYGLHTEDVEDVERILSDAHPIELTLGPLALFKHDDYDVLFATVTSPYLHELNALISDRLQVTDTHPRYSPHATIAYLKSGLGEDYLNDDSLVGETVIIDEVMFSNTDEEHTPIRLRGELKVAKTVDSELSADERRLVDHLESLYAAGEDLNIVPSADGRFTVNIAETHVPVSPPPPVQPNIIVHPPNIVVNVPAQAAPNVTVNMPKMGGKKFTYGLVDGKMRPTGTVEDDADGA